MKKLFLIPAAVLGFTVAQGQTNVSGGNVSGTWTLAGSPYLIQGSIMVPNDSTLTIQPGVTVNFQNTYKLLVLGRLLAIGTVTDTITFTAANTTNGWRGIRFDNTPITNDTSKIKYCKLQYGKATGASPDDKGGTFYFSNFSKAIISNCLISNGSANAGGGGIYCDGSSPTISNNTILNSSAPGAGGGGIACIYSSNPQIFNNTISNNTSYEGGGIRCSMNSNPQISGNSIFNNSAPGAGGGGIACTNSSNPQIFNNTISNNSSGGIEATNSSGPAIFSNIISYNSGGGILITNSSSPTISNNTISNNSLYGGIYLLSSTATISNNSISNNTTSSNGGGIRCINSSPIIINSTIVNNASNNGGSLYCESNSNPTLQNCILYGNTASTSGAQVYLYDEPSDPNFYYCDVQGGTAAFEVNFNIYTGIYQNNINTSPIFVSPSSGSGTGFNGVTADWSLQTSSSCIDAGDPLGFYPSTDLAGNPRLENVTNCIIDMGAYEYQSVLCPNNGIMDLINDQIYIQIFPNPFSVQTTLQTNNPFHNATLTVYNCFGQAVKEIKNINGQTIVLHRDNLSSGLYFVRLTEENKIIAVNKLVITDK